MASRVVRPETSLLKISQDDWLLVKKRLNHGEQTQAFARRYRSEAEGVRVNLERVDIWKVLAYLLDWSLVGLDGKQMVIQDQPIEVVETFLNVIDPESFAEIAAAINAHELAQEQERAEAKKIQGGAIDSPVISPSPVVAAGASPTSVN